MSVLGFDRLNRHKPCIEILVEDGDWGNETSLNRHKPCIEILLLKVYRIVLN